MRIENDDNICLERDRLVNWFPCKFALPCGASDTTEGGWMGGEGGLKTQEASRGRSTT